MDLTSIKNIKTLLNNYEARPSRHFGQNFLTDKDAINKIIDTAEINNQNVVLEIGPGLGTLTQELAKKAKKIVAVEKDIKMVDILKETMKDYNNAIIIYGDALNLNNWKSEVGDDFKVVANLPFYLTAPIIRKLLENKKANPISMTLVVQKEVGQRICPACRQVGPTCRQAGAKPPRMNILAVSVQIYAEVKIISYISKKSFWPEPEVDAAIIKITPKEFPKGDMDLFFKIVKAGFSHPRKQLSGNLSKSLKMDKEKVAQRLEKNNIKPNQRAETLSIEDWKNLSANYLN